MELSDYLRVLRKFWVSITAVTLLGIIGAAIITRLATPSYTASAALFITVQSGEDPSELAQGSSYTERQVVSFAELAEAPIVLQPVIDELTLGGTPAQLAERVTVTVPTNTSIIEIAVADADAKRAAATARAVGDTLIRTVSDIAPKDRSGEPSVEATLISPATIPTSPTSPKVAQNLSLGFMVGLLLGVGQALLRTALDRKVRNADHLAQITDAPLIGTVPFDPDAADGQLTQVTAPNSPRAEEYRRVRTNVQFLGVDERGRCLAFTSSVAGEGKTTTVLNVAVALAEAGKRVLLVDADLRRPKVAERLNLEGSVGLSTILLGRASLDDVRQPFLGLDVLPAGQVPPNPSELLGSDAMRRLMLEATHRYEYVLLDSSPLVPVADTVVLAPAIGGVVLVVGSGEVDGAELDTAIASVQAVEGRVLGIVLNKLKSKDASYRRPGYYRGTYEPDTDATSKPRRAVEPS